MLKQIAPFLLCCLLAACNGAPASSEGAASAPSQAAPATAPAEDPYAPHPYVKFQHTEWTRDAVLYQINTRQFTPEGTFAAAEAQLPRLKDLGVDILWLMPVQPIGEKNRKGSLGSPYSVKDYYGVNPEFGTLDDLKSFIQAAHALGMHVILDWVANHTAWDNPLVTEHPDWYDHDWKGDFHPTPWLDWSDIIDLDYDQPGLRKYMTDVMKYWVAEVGFDGFRCDVAGYVPLDFWENLRRELDAIKPVFMLAEWQSRDLHAHAFDATYAWDWYNTAHAVAKGDGDVGAFFGYYSSNESAWPKDGYRMTFVSNHDKNAWDGTQFEQFGDALEAMIVLSVAGEGMPLIYNGQEAGNEKRLEFFEKDPIVWRPHPIGALYKKLFALKHETKALWNGAAGARMISVINSKPSKVLSFVRFGDKDGVFVVINFTPEPQTIRYSQSLHYGDYIDYLSGETVSFDENTTTTLGPWGYRVYVKR